MANPEHVAVVRKGAAYIENWRRKHPRQTLDLQEADFFDAYLHDADLSEADLSSADLSDAILWEANLSKANLSGAELYCTNLYNANLSGARLNGAKLIYSGLIGANLRGATFSGAEFFETNLSDADLSEAVLSNADLSYTNLNFANLSDTDLSNANLVGVKFISPDLSGSKFTGSVMGDTTFGACNLAKCIGLETVKHDGPNNVDFRTLKISFFAAGGRFTSEMKMFFLNSGISKKLIDTLPEIFAGVQYCTSFICYGNPDLKFAKKLKEDLVAKGVPCWLYSLDATPGKRTWKEITSRRREAEKMIVLCSAKALVRDGVLKEIEEQIDEDPDKLIPISLDNLWKENGFSVKRGKRDLKPFLLERNYADFSNESAYKNSLRKLLKGLKRT